MVNEAAIKLALDDLKSQEVINFAANVVYQRAAHISDPRTFPWRYHSSPKLRSQHRGN